MLPQMDETQLSAKYRVMVILWGIIWQREIAIITSCLLFALIGMLLHFPKRDQLAAAAYRQQNRIGRN